MEKKNLLLIEDDDSDAKIFTVLIEKKFSVFRAETLASAKRQLIAGPDFSGIVLDYNMVGLDGGAALKELSAIASGVPIIVLTGYTDPSQQLEIIHSGAIDCVWKGVGKRWLVSSVERALEWDKLEKRLEKYGINGERRGFSASPRAAVPSS